MQGPRAAVRLDPVPARAVRRDQRAGPKANLFRPQGRVGHFQHDAAHVFVGEEIVAGELQVVQGALRVEEKGIAAPAREEAVVAGLRHLCLPPRRDRRPLDDSLPAVARPGGLRALNAAQRRGLRPALGGREAHAVRDIGDGISVRVNLELIERLGREGLGGGGPRRVHARRTGARS